jgi:DNA mismatch repair protein MutL
VGEPARLPPGSWQYFLVNGRPVDDRFLYAAVREGFARTAVRGERPDFILALSIDPAEVDVNVHPTKREVRFRSPSVVAGLISGAVARALAAGEAPTIPAAWDAGRPSASSWTPASPLPLGEVTGPGYARSPDADAGVSPPAGGGFILGQALAGWLVVAEPERLLLVDQHAAHERVLFERVMKRFRAGSSLSQRLLVPEELSVQPQDVDRMEAALPLLARAGATLEATGPRTFLVTALPPEVGPGEVAAFVRGLISLAVEAGEDLDRDAGWWEGPAALVACHGAVKMGDALTPQDMDRLLRDLLACEDPLRCPHGRPTMVVLDRPALERLFGRR